MLIPLSFAHMASPIHLLPVELLSRIFHVAVLSQPIPDDRDSSQLTYEVAISHVCRHWRNVALHMPHLWTIIHFRTKLHLARGDVYLNRSQRLPIDVWVDTCSDDAYNLRKDLIFRDEFLPTFNVVLPHIQRWRELHLRVADLQCKASARKVLNSCGSAPTLRTLQLWHVQNWRTPERLFTAIGPPPVVVFGGDLPSLKHIILQGVNLPWAGSPFLCNLTSIEYALHSDDVRMPFDLWHAMLRTSPNLQRISLLYSGPRARSSGVYPPDGIDWWGADPPGPDDILAPGAEPPPSTTPVLLPNLRELHLHDLDPDYIVAVFKSLDAPNLRSLTLELDTDDQDFAPFVAYLAAPPDRKFHHHSHNTTGSPAVNTPKFPHLETLAVAALRCSTASWRQLLESAPGLTRLEADFAHLPDDAFDVLFSTAPADKTQDAADVPILPRLESVRFAGATGKQLAQLVAFRRKSDRTIRRWEVEDSVRDEDAEALERALEERSAQWRRDEEDKDRQAGRVREPWRWDEPAERLVWFREEAGEESDGEDDEGEDEDEGEYEEGEDEDDP